MGIMHLLGLHSLVRLGPMRLRTLIDAMGDCLTAWENFDAWQQILGSGIDYAELKKEYERVDLPALYEKFLLSDAKLVTCADFEYPRLLKQIPEAPYALFYKGELPSDEDITVAIVGSRRATAYGREAAGVFANGLAREGAWVVGGMARGIDSAAHQAALDAGGKTIGVLGCGIDVVYPPENGKLYAQTIANGCIISEYPMGMQPLSRNFPQRNRLISGLSRAVLVVEAEKHSGTQITVNFAALQNRRIYAVPGSIFSSASAGTLALIREEKAAVATCAADILEDIGENLAEAVPKAKGKPAKGTKQEKAAKTQKNVDELRHIGQTWAEERNTEEQDMAEESMPQQLNFAVGKPLPSDPQESRLVEFVTEQKHFNDIVRYMGSAASEVATMLTLLELSGFVKRLDGQYYIRSQV